MAQYTRYVLACQVTKFVTQWYFHIVVHHCFHYWNWGATVMTDLSSPFATGYDLHYSLWCGRWRQPNGFSACTLIASIDSKTCLCDKEIWMGFSLCHSIYDNHCITIKILDFLPSPSILSILYIARKHFVTVWTNWIQVSIHQLR